MKIDFEYRIHDSVKILALETTGRVIGLYVCLDGIQYRVRYFYNGDLKSEYFFDSELGSLTSTSKTQTKKNHDN